MPNISLPYPMMPHQRILSEWQPSDGEMLIKAMVCGYGGGKTHALVREMTRLAIENAPIPVLNVEPTYPMVRDILVPAYEEYYESIGMPFAYNQQANRITLSEFNAQIWLRSGDNPTRLKGPNIAAAAIDEPFIQDRDVFKQVIARVRHPKARKRVILLTGTPEGLGWGYEELYEKCTLTDTIYSDGVRIDLYDGPGRRWLRTSSEINTALPADYLDALRGAHTDLELKSYLAGEFTNLTQGRIYYAYTPENDGPAELELGLPVIIACDFNVSERPMSWCVMQERTDGLYVRASLQKQYTDTRAMCEHLETWFIDTYGALPQVLKFYGDYSGTAAHSSSFLSDWQTIEAYFFQSGKARGSARYQPCTSIRDSAAAVNALLCNGKGERRLFLHPGKDTDGLRRDFERVTWKEDGTKQDECGDPMRTHSADGVRYYAMIEHPIRKQAKRSV